LQFVRFRRSASALAVLAHVAAGRAGAQELPSPPTAEEAETIRASLVAMKSTERGPYERLRWFCTDGSVHPPQGTPCSELGGGVQHAEPSNAARRLAELGYHVGTILQATPYEAFADEEHGGYRMSELVLERYLVQVDDGWVLRRARYYRGALQVEDEERSGRALLERRFEDGAWLRANALLATRLAASVPHTGIAVDRTMDRIRATASEIADLDPGFQRLRVRIHSVPSRSDIEAVSAYLAGRDHEPEVRSRLVSLRDDLVLQYDPERALASLDSFRGRVDGLLAGMIDRLTRAVQSGDPEQILTEIVALAPVVREHAESAPSGARALDLIDLQLALQERAFVLATELDDEGIGGTRAEAIERLQRYVTLAYAGGYLSRREHDALHAEAAGLLDVGAPTAGAYKASLGYLGRGLDWARGTVRGAFGPVLARYAPVEPAAASLSDALLRGSVLLPLSQTLDVLQADADRALGSTHELFGRAESSGMRGLNPGVALGPLAILEPGHEGVDEGTIYLLEETPPELEPVAGVLTLSEGNLLSHVQLLARNLGIPNASVAPTHAARLRAAAGRDVFYAVTPMGRVIVKSPDDLEPREAALVGEDAPAPTERHRLDTSRLRLDVRRPIGLEALRARDSGVLVGPKAANLGQLAADFPGRVSPAVALPFGMFAEHADRPFDGSERTVLEELRTAYARAAAMRVDGASEAQIDGFMLERLAWVRTAIEGLEWKPEMRERVVRAVDDVLQGDVTRGVFVRSDTNVEDLPQFSGAGLNLTVPHQTSMDAILASIKRVWTSPFSERAYLWRRQILEEQGDVYPSVLLQETVPSEKSGVLITSGLQEGGPGDLTVVAAEGVGGAVEGEDAETLLIGPEGSVRLLSQAKSAQRREVVTGGTRWVAARRPDVLLAPDEIAQLRAVVGTWSALKAGTPDEDTTWDIEYGFLDGRLWLFQIRPFIRFRNSDVYARLEALDAVAAASADARVDLAAPPETR